MSIFKKVLKCFVNILTTILLLVLALVVYGKATVIFFDNAYPNYFGYTFFSIASGSMEPTLYVNDVILIKIADKDLNPGDVITYAKNKEIITHRIISIENDTLTVKGDNNNTIDDPINKSQVIGKMVKVYPKLSIWQKVITEPKILVTAFITLLLIDFAISYKGKGKEQNKKEKVKLPNINIKKIELPFKTKKKKEEVKKEEVKSEKKEEFVNDFTQVIELPKKGKNKEVKVEVVSKGSMSPKEEELLKTVANLDKKEIQKMLELEDQTIELPKVKTATEKDLNYTVRLDLSEISKKIKRKVK